MKWLFGFQAPTGQDNRQPQSSWKRAMPLTGRSRGP